MAELRDIGAAECEELLRSHDLGRIAVCTADGPHIVPVNYVVVDDAHGPLVVVRTAAYSRLGTEGPGKVLALQVDEVDRATESGWSIEVRGRAELANDLRHRGILTEDRAPRPWASGYRSMFLQLRWTEINGRRLLAS